MGGDGGGELNLVQEVIPEISLSLKACRVGAVICCRYLLKIIGSGENVRLQYRSLRKIRSSEAIEDEEERCNSHQLQNGGS